MFVCFFLKISLQSRQVFFFFFHSVNINHSIVSKSHECSFFFLLLSFCSGRKRRSSADDGVMDDCMAAMVLMSLSCSPKSPCLPIASTYLFHFSITIKINVCDFILHHMSVARYYDIHRLKHLCESRQCAIWHYFSRVSFTQV